MKINIITFHFVNNFGAALQAYALSQATSKLNNQQTIMVDYRHWFIRFTDTVRILPISKDPKIIKHGLKTIPQRLGRLKKFDSFHKERFKMSARYNTRKSLQQYPQEDSMFICGSDQIWNPVVTLGVKGVYYLSFVRSSKRKISYAASFGISDIAPKYRAKMEKYLKGFKAIGVREAEGVELVKDISGRTATQVIDPTFLLSKDEWSEIAISPQIDEPYILVYVMQSNESVYEYARQIKAILGIQLIAISRYGDKPAGVDKVVIDIGPYEFLGLFENATYICTNSFHGLAFALIFEKNFFIIPSNRFNSRIDSLLQVMGVTLEKEVTHDNILNPKINHSEIKQHILSARQHSLEFLQKNLSL
ncbi:MAG: hypothetical protein BEN18_02200 [Epulopiscium sp. Nuni2H_MBin001]|nr:MAG: hypothetical protein BEN18_02200 [Epulopiscium sp. Nuni2H_MBin001]